MYSDWRAAHSPDIDPNVLKNNAGAFSVSDAALALPDLLNAVKQDSEGATQKVNDLIKGTRVGDDTASQIAAQRYWARTQRTLDAIQDPGKVVAAAQNLVANAEDAQTPVLAEELSEYLASRNVPVGWLTDALASKIPGLPKATSDAILKSRQYAVLQRNHNALTNAFSKDVAAPPLSDPAIATATPYGG
jgi:hypothetical protein